LKDITQAFSNSTVFVLVAHVHAGHSYEQRVCLGVRLFVRSSQSCTESGSCRFRNPVTRDSSFWHQILCPCFKRDCRGWKWRKTHFFDK